MTKLQVWRYQVAFNATYSGGDTHVTGRKITFLKMYSSIEPPKALVRQAADTLLNSQEQRYCLKVNRSSVQIRG